MSTTGGGVTSAVRELGPVSPELALVDPDLARLARELMSDPAVPSVTEHSIFIERLRTILEPVPDLDPPRRRARLGRLASAAGFAGLVVVVTLLVGREKGPPPRQQPTGSVASAVSPTDAGDSTSPATSGALHEPGTPGHTFTWVAAPNAVAYDFQLLEGGERVFRARVDKPRLELPGRWRWSGLPHALVPGSYRWYVWPVSRRTNRRSTVAIVDRRLAVEPR
jgi:hypothetical protein